MTRRENVKTGLCLVGGCYALLAGFMVLLGAVERAEEDLGDYERRHFAFVAHVQADLVAGREELVKAGVLERHDDCDGLGVRYIAAARPRGIGAEVGDP